MPLNLPPRLVSIIVMGTSKAALTTLVLCLAGCSGERVRTQDPMPCIPGESRACVGVGGCSGGQACNLSGTGFAPCDCGGAGDASMMGSDAAATSPDAGTPPPNTDAGVVEDGSLPDVRRVDDAGSRGADSGSASADASDNRALEGMVRAGLVRPLGAVVIGGPRGIDVTIDAWLSLPGASSVTIYNGGPWKLRFAPSGTEPLRSEFLYRCENSEGRERSLSFSLTGFSGWSHLSLQLTRNSVRVWSNGRVVYGANLSCELDATASAYKFVVGDEDGLLLVDEVHVIRIRQPVHPDMFQPEYPMTSIGSSLLLWSITGADTGGAADGASAADGRLMTSVTTNGPLHAQIWSGTWTSQGVRR